MKKRKEAKRINKKISRSSPGDYSYSGTMKKMARHGLKAATRHINFRPEKRVRSRWMIAHPARESRRITSY